MIPAEFVTLLFSAASIERWNDHPRPMPFTELDKQAHKAIIAWVLARAEEDAGKSIDWEALIGGTIAECLHRIVLTDLKPPIFHRLMAEKGQALTEWALERLAPAVTPVADGALFTAIRTHLTAPAPTLERRILKAAHYLATQWEFRLIYHTAPFLYGIEQTKAAIEGEIEAHYDLIGVQKIALGKRLFGFVDLVGQLRFQQRWAQTPRLPKTSVLGHLLFVAILSYCGARELGAKSVRRRCNAFYGALFHDLPEVLTRDVISPIKREAPGVEALLKAEERRLMAEVLLPLLPDNWHAQLRAYTETEFACRVREHGEWRILADETVPEALDRDACDPIDGPLIKAMDELAALTEAAQSLAHGVRAPALVEANLRLPEKYHGKRLGALDLGALFAVLRFEG
ncbi:HD domain-containing protein [Hydrogenophilus thermoluteolus]|uniref:HAD family hydrolase n=1 Tax=Hydrogenophilus thermoluteolus TaxID=297 RepID=A0A2Z6DZC1_HYDTE|nr:HD domain-containing protein [Hydrogenophilus thermoluteolus]BBD77906.1 HAD family hydrolase [Hydrogenophilus thermoluteolus]